MTLNLASLEVLWTLRRFFMCKTVRKELQAAKRKEGLPLRRDKYVRLAIEKNL